MIRDGLLITLESKEEEQELLNEVYEHVRKEFNADEEDFLDNELRRIYLMYAFPNIGD
jgi:hypothetical protein